MSANKYQTHVKPKLALIAGWARDGLSEKQIASNLGVAYSTFRDYKSKQPALSAALKESKDTADFKVENALFENSTGKYVTEKKAFKVKEVYYDANNRRCEREKIVVVEVETYIKPDTLAQAIWLNNRKPDKWKRNANKEMLDAKKFEHQKKKDEKNEW